MNHPNLTKLPMDKVREELTESRKHIAEFLGEAPLTFANPYGAGEDDPLIRKAVQDSGYRLGIGIHAGKWTPDQMTQCPYGVPRVFIRGEENMLDFHLQCTRGQSRL
jgi:peptidoglycan/xylan/chitin deacetylase (PgdA/CDA1 family)